MTATRLKWGRRAVAFAFISIGVMHFLKPQPFVSIVPDWLPWPLHLVYVSGFFEIAGGIGLLTAQWRRAASIGIIFLLIAVFPANINMLIKADKFPSVPLWLLWLRLPLQILIGFIVWKVGK